MPFYQELFIRPEPADGGPYLFGNVRFARVGGRVLGGRLRHVAEGLAGSLIAALYSDKVDCLVQRHGAQPRLDPVAIPYRRKRAAIGCDKVFKHLQEDVIHVGFHVDPSE